MRNCDRHSPHHHRLLASRLRPPQPTNTTPNGNDQSPLSSDTTAGSDPRASNASTGMAKTHYGIVLSDYMPVSH